MRRFIPTGLVLAMAASGCGGRPLGVNGRSGDAGAPAKGAPAGGNRAVPAEVPPQTTFLPPADAGPAPADVSPAPDAAGPASLTPPNALLPFAPGNWWKYQVLIPGAPPHRKITTIGPATPVGGEGPNAIKQAFLVTTLKGPDGVKTTDKTESWQTVVNQQVIRYREINYEDGTVAADGIGGNVISQERWEPHRLVVDLSPEHALPGAAWSESYREWRIDSPTLYQANQTREEPWSVAEVDVEVRVPAGAFRCVHLRKVTGGGASLKNFWYAPGVGKVKELGGQVEELVEYSVR